LQIFTREVAEIRRHLPRGVTTHSTGNRVTPC
jgi:hypothetical protein